MYDLSPGSGRIGTILPSAMDLPLRKEELNKSRMEALVTDKELSILAPRLGKDWRSFMRTELCINQWQIEDVEMDSGMPTNEKIYKLLRKWKNKKKHECTVSCLIEHLSNFEFSVDTWAFLTESNEAEEQPVIEKRLNSLDIKPLHSLQSADLSSSPLRSNNDSRNSNSYPESPYDKLHAIGSPGPVVPKFRFVVEVTEEINISAGFDDHLHFTKGSKLDVVNNCAVSYLARDVEGHVFHIPKNKCRRADMFCTSVLSENVWFHEKVDRTQIDELFEGKEVGTFLIRHASEPGNFALSVKGYRSVLHFKVGSTQTGYTVSGDHYYSFTDLISTYNGIAVYSTPDGKVFLRHPLPKD